MPKLETHAFLIELKPTRNNLNPGTIVVRGTRADIAGNGALTISTGRYASSVEAMVVAAFAGGTWLSMRQEDHHRGVTFPERFLKEWEPVPEEKPPLIEDELEQVSKFREVQFAYGNLLSRAAAEIRELRHDVGTLIDEIIQETTP